MVAADIATAGHPGVEAGEKEEAIRFWGPAPHRLLVVYGLVYGMSLSNILTHMLTLRFGPFVVLRLGQCIGQ